MKTIIRHIVSFAMAFLVLFSTISFTVGMHFCGEHLVDFSLNKKAETCGMDAMMTDAMGEQMNMGMDDCCSEVNIVQQGQDDLKISFEKITFEQQLFVATFISSYIDLFHGLNNNVVPHKEYPPPFLIQDVIILDQQFLI
ncbi:hypothetical protein OO009_09315 [Flavobacteriaceae bacterium KMM 6897]|nr:hypothetical protein [Flavobacteriaceae bacterium KMM 6897]MEB8344506.1 hypothetical protein [Flavobacteriaceae bacterium KMM 6898]